MSLEDKIKDQFLADTESILEDSLEALDGWFRFHSDGTTNLSPEIRELSAKNQMLVYLIAERYASEADLAENSGLDNNFFYSRFSQKEGTIRNYQKALRDEGLIQTEGGTHEITVENLPKAIQRIEEAFSTNSS